MSVAKHILVTGRVQRVMYRDFAQRKARRLGIFGTVRNLKDGTVEIYAEGEKETLDIYIEKLHKGPLLARVESVRVEDIEPWGNYRGFDILV